MFELLGKLVEIAVELLAITDGGVCKSVEFVAVLVTLPALPPSAMPGGLLDGRSPCCRLPCCGAVGTLLVGLPAGWPCTLALERDQYEIRKESEMVEQTLLQINTRKFN